MNPPTYDAKSPFTAVVIARNEADRVADCLQNLTWCREVILVNDASNDDTKITALRCGARVIDVQRSQQPVEYLHKLGFLEVTEGWIVRLDIDEYVRPELVEFLSNMIVDGGQDLAAFDVARENLFFRSPLRHGGMLRPEQRKFFRHDRWDRDWDCEIHSPVPTIGRVFRVDPTANRTVVHPLYDSWSSFVAKSLRSYSLQEADYRGSLNKYERILFPVFLLAETLKVFVGRVFIRGGFLDGWRGILWGVYLGLYRGSVLLGRRQLGRREPRQAGRRAGGSAIKDDYYFHR